MDFNLKHNYHIDDLIKIVKILRGENGCPWDKQQDHKSIRKNLIEEAYEVVEAIDYDDTDLLKEELGDLLLQVVFHTQIEAEKNQFSFEDVCNDICKKLIQRHPHVFGGTVVDSTQQVLDNWEAIKRQQKGNQTYTQSLQSVPKVLPSLMRSEKAQSRAAKAGFDYPDITYALDDLKSELNELQAAIDNNDIDNIDEEIGDLIFSCVNISRLKDIDPEHSLSKSCEKFIKRFSQVEALSTEKNIDMKNADINTLNQLWNMAKQNSNS